MSKAEARTPRAKRGVAEKAPGFMERGAEIYVSAGE